MFAKIVIDCVCARSQQDSGNDIARAALPHDHAIDGTNMLIPVDQLRVSFFDDGLNSWSEVRELIVARRIRERL